MIVVGPKAIRFLHFLLCLLRFPPMEALINALINAGGMGILSAALLWLHASAIPAFREELKTECRLFREALRAIGVAILIDDISDQWSEQHVPESEFLTFGKSAKAAV